MTLLGDAERSTLPRVSSPAISSLIVRVQSEFVEMPGLRLTEAQARRLWTLDNHTCRAVLTALIERGFLKRSPKGHYLRARV